MSISLLLLFYYFASKKKKKKIHLNAVGYHKAFHILKHFETVISKGALDS